MVGEEDEGNAARDETSCVEREGGGLIGPRVRGMKDHEYVRGVNEEEEEEEEESRLAPAHCVMGLRPCTNPYSRVWPGAISHDMVSHDVVSHDVVSHDVEGQDRVCEGLYHGIAAADTLCSSEYEVYVYSRK